MYREGGEANPHLRRHFLILPIGRAIRATTGLAPEDALALLSALSAAAIPALAYAALRGAGSGLAAAALAAGLLALAPTTVFYGRHVELHAPHGAAAALALVPALRGGRRVGGIGGALLVLGPLALLAGTHAGGVLQVAFVAALGAVTASGRRRALYAAIAAPSTLACAAATAWLVAIQSGWVGRPAPGEPFYALGSAFAHPWKFGPGQFLEYSRLTIVPGAGALLALGGVGLVLGLRRERAAFAVLVAWVVSTLYAYGAWGFTKHGGYLLPTYPALAVGAAVLFTRIRSRPVARAVAAVALSLQAFLAVRIASLDLDEPHPLVWAADAREATGDRGILVTDWLPHRTMARLHTSLEVVNTGLLAQAPEADRARLAAALLAALARAVDDGTPVFLDAELEKFREEWPDLDRLLEDIRRRFALEPADRGAFRGWRLSLR